MTDDYVGSCDSGTLVPGFTDTSWNIWCTCVLPPGHETPHVCLCGGGWMVTTDRLLIYEWAGGPDIIRENETPLSRANEYAHRLPIATKLAHQSLHRSHYPVT